MSLEDRRRVVRQGAVRDGPAAKRSSAAWMRGAAGARLAPAPPPAVERAQPQDRAGRRRRRGRARQVSTPVTESRVGRAASGGRGSGRGRACIRCRRDRRATGPRPRSCDGRAECIRRRRPLPAQPPGVEPPSQRDCTVGAPPSAGVGVQQHLARRAGLGEVVGGEADAALGRRQAQCASRIGPRQEGSSTRRAARRPPPARPAPAGRRDQPGLDGAQDVQPRMGGADRSAPSRSRSRSSAGRRTRPAWPPGDGSRRRAAGRARAPASASPASPAQSVARCALFRAATVRSIRASTGAPSRWPARAPRSPARGVRPRSTASARSCPPAWRQAR